MSPIARIRVTWTGFIGGPGVSTFYCLDPATFRPGLVTYWNAVKGNLPQTCNITVESEGDIINDVDGEVTGTWSAGTPAAMAGGDTGVYSAPTGICVTWKTNTIASGKHLRGRTFLVPFTLSAFDLDGSLSAAARLNQEQKAQALVAASPGQMLVWHRPRKATTLKPFRPGSSGAVSTAVVADKAAVLRSRRD